MIRVVCRIVPLDPEVPDLPGSWYVTHGLGSPAAGLYTEIVLPSSVDVGLMEEVARQAAFEAYGNQWAFLYPPGEREATIERYELRRRERLEVSKILPQ